jgi:hypothetical protein
MRVIGEEAEAEAETDTERTEREAHRDQAEEAEADSLLDACMLTCYFLNFCSNA